MSYTLSDYPSVIEPTAEVLEITGGTDSLKWVQLHRIPTHVVLNQLAGITSGLVHFFGLSADLTVNKFILAYTTGGLLQKILRRDSNGWEIIEIPLEALGTPVVRPSLRLVFQTERARATLIHYISQVVSGKIRNPSLELALEQLVEPPLVIDVWKAK